MNTVNILVRLLLVGALLFWTMNVLAVAAFAVPDRTDGAQAVFLSLLVVLFGLLLPPVVIGLVFRRELGLDRAFFRPQGGQGAADGRSAAPEDAAAAKPHLAEPLSERELEVLALVARGLSNKEIARDLSISLGTVKTHTNNLYRKLGARRRTDAIARGRSLGLV